jgi:uncharacterized membrane-anchored protein
MFLICPLGVYFCPFHGVTPLIGLSRISIFGLSVRFILPHPQGQSFGGKMSHPHWHNGLGLGDDVGEAVLGDNLTHRLEGVGSGLLGLDQCVAG